MDLGNASSKFRMKKKEGGGGGGNNFKHGSDILTQSNSE